MVVGFVVVRSDEIVAVEKFGEFQRILGSGLHILGWDLCNIVWTTRRVSKRIEEARVRVETKTKDNVFVTISIFVQMQVKEDSAFDALYKLSNPHGQIESYVANVIRGHVPKLGLDDVFLQKDELAHACQDELAKKMSEFGYVIHAVLLTDVEPARNVKEAMNEINASRRMHSRICAPSLPRASIAC